MGSNVERDCFNCLHFGDNGCVLPRQCQGNLYDKWKSVNYLETESDEENWELKRDNAEEIINHVVNHIDEPYKQPSIYEIREQGREYCQTEGADHYKEGDVEPLDLLMSKGTIEDFCIGSITKYATRFKETQDINDLKKVSDYAHILAGVKLEEG